MSSYIQSSMDRYVHRNRDHQIPSTMDRSDSSSANDQHKPMPSAGSSWNSGHAKKPFQFMASIAPPTNIPPLKRSLSNASTASGSHQPTKRQQTTLTTTTTTDSTATAPPKRMQLRSGSIVQLLQWRRERPAAMDACTALCETYARVVRIADGPKLATHRVLLLRDDNARPVMAGHYYGIDVELPDDVRAGSLVRCVGAFLHSGQFQVYKCRCVMAAVVAADADADAPPPLQQDEQHEAVAALLARLTALSDHAIVAGAREEAQKTNVGPALVNKL